MDYVFDNNTLTAIFRHYYYDRFPTFWSKFNQLISENRICSVREVRREIEILRRGDSLEEWMKQHTEFFETPDIEELNFITEIYKIPHFQQNMEMKKRLKGGPFADPFIIAKAKTENAYVVTQEQYKDNAAKIPNICQYFNIACTDLEGFLKKEDWIF